jgi:hypothetical protein
MRFNEKSRNQQASPRAWVGYICAARRDLRLSARYDVVPVVCPQEVLNCIVIDADGCTPIAKALLVAIG